jgi:hypothetical protein
LPQFRFEVGVLRLGAQLEPLQVAVPPPPEPALAEPPEMSSSLSMSKNPI